MATIADGSEPFLTATKQNDGSLNDILVYVASFLEYSFKNMLICKFITRQLHFRLCASIRVIDRFFFRFRTLPDIDIWVSTQFMQLPLEYEIYMNYSLCEMFDVDDCERDPFQFFTKKYLIRQFIRYHPIWYYDDISRNFRSVHDNTFNTEGIALIRDCLRGILSEIIRDANLYTMLDIQFERFSPRHFRRLLECFTHRQLRYLYWRGVLYH